MFGPSDAATQWLTIGFWLIATMMLYDAGRLLVGPGAALWACAMMALAPPMIDLSLQIRGYVPMLAISLGAFAALIRMERFGPNVKRSAALGGCLLAAMLTHYFALGGALAIGAYSLIRLRGRPRQVALMACALAATVYLAVWGPFLWQQRHNFS